MPVPVAPVRARISRAKVTGPPPRSDACSTATAAAAAIAPATAAQAATISGTAPVRPLSGPSAVDGRRRPSRGERGRGVGEPGSSRKYRVEIEAENSPAATYEPRAAWWKENHSSPEPSRLPMSVAISRTAAAAGTAAKSVRRESLLQRVEVVRQRAYRGALRGRGGQQRGRGALLGDGPQPFADAGDEDGDEDHHECLVGHPVDPQRCDDEQCEPQPVRSDHQPPPVQRSAGCGERRQRPQ